MNKIEYAEYRKSAWYDQVQSSTKARAKGICQACGSAEFLHCHHMNYGCLWNEAPGRDTICLCCHCHAITHNKQSPIEAEKIDAIIKPMPIDSEQLEKLFFNSVISDLHRNYFA